MMSGEFARAHETFQEFNADNEEPSPEWRLKEWALGIIRARAGEVQSRKVEEAERLADVSDSSLSDAQRRRRLARALDADVLCAPAWFNLALLEGKEERFGLAFTAFLVAALIARHAVEPWARAIVLALGQPDETLLQDAMRAAYLFNRDDFVKEMSRVASELPVISLRERLQAELEAAIAAGLPTGGPFQFRILEEGGSYEVITIPSSEA
jgi:hypothetical protein